VSHAREQALVASPPEVSYEPRALFLGRLEAYKGLDVLLEAARRCNGEKVGVIIAGQGSLGRPGGGKMPDNTDVRNRLIQDAEAVELFQRCGVVVLPYREASQSALVAAAYFFRKPVIVTQVGALPEYVVKDGDRDRTGWVIPAGDARALAGAITDALAAPARLAQMGRAGRAWYDVQRQVEGQTLGQMYALLAG
jgi:glycosyltransferase involved in cell wall biosynthesis